MKSRDGWVLKDKVTEIYSPKHVCPLLVSVMFTVQSGVQFNNNIRFQKKKIPASKSETGIRATPNVLPKLSLLILF